MSFNPNIPQANDIISTSQQQLLDNFTQLNTQFAIDHIAWNAGSDNGKHIKITYVEQLADPTTLVNEIALYTKDVGGVPRLFIREESNGTVYQFSGPTPSNATNGYSWLPGGLLVKWGSFSTANSTLQTLVYPAGGSIPAFSAAPYFVIPSIESGAGVARVFVSVRTGTNAAASVQFNTVDQNNNPIGVRTLYYYAVGPS